MFFFAQKRSTMSSRSDVDLVREFKFKHSGQSWKGIPLISNMDTVSSDDMFRELSRNQCITCFHKYIDVKELVAQ